MTITTPPEPVRPPKDARGPAGTDRVEIALPNGRRLVVDAAVDAPVLARLIQVLDRA